MFGLFCFSNTTRRAYCIFLMISKFLFIISRTFLIGPKYIDSWLTEAATGGDGNDGLENFGKFTGKHLCRSLFFKKLHPWTCNSIKRDTPKQMLFYEFCEIFKNTFFTEHLRPAASGLKKLVTGVLQCNCSGKFGKILRERHFTK